MLKEQVVFDAVEPLAQAALGSLLMTSILEQLDHGILLLGRDGRVLHANRVARRECAQHGAIRLEQGRLSTQRQLDAGRLARALAAAQRGRRTLLQFESDEHSLPLVVLPLSLGAAADAGSDPGLILVLMARRSGAEALNLELFAQAHGLTLAEGAMLKGLSRGLNPLELAQDKGIAVTTVRTHILHIRQKTRTSSIRALLRVVNNLPPVVCATELQH